MKKCIVFPTQAQSPIAEPSVNLDEYQEFGARNRAPGEKTVLSIEKVF
jgi:hypothetical protein